MDEALTMRPKMLAPQWVPSSTPSIPISLIQLVQVQEEVCYYQPHKYAAILLGRILSPQSACKSWEAPFMLMAGMATDCQEKF